MIKRCRSASAVLLAAGLAAIAATLAACGAKSEVTPDPQPATVGAYRDLPDAARLAAAAGCRDRAKRRTEGIAARQLGGVDDGLLRRQLDIAVADYRARNQFERACAATLPLVTPGLRVTFSGVTGNGIEFSYPTRSDRPLTIRGMVEPVPTGAHVVMRREYGPSQRLTAPIDDRGEFVFRDVKLHRVADNTFLLTIAAPPNAPRVVRFSALCQDCIISGSPPP